MLTSYFFRDRKQAGKMLGEYLKKFHLPDPVVLVLPRGGVTVGHEVAKILNAPLDVVVARKIGAPHHPEYGIGALSEDENPLFNPEGESYFNVSGPEVQETLAREKNELRRRIQHYRKDRNMVEVKDKSVIVVDDGLATGVTAAVAGRFLRGLRAKSVVLAVPLAPMEIRRFVTKEFDEIIVLYRPEQLSSVGQWYEDFDQVEDHEVMAILKYYHPDQSSSSSLDL